MAAVRIKRAVTVEAISAVAKRTNTLITFRNRKGVGVAVVE